MGRIRNPLSMISGRGGYHTPGPLLHAEMGDFVICPSDFEGKDGLLVFSFQKYLIVRFF